MQIQQSQLSQDLERQMIKREDWEIIFLIQEREQLADCHLTDALTILWPASILFYFCLNSHLYF